LLGEIRPWQAVFLIVGIPGALLAFSIFTVPEPERRGRRMQQKSVGVADTYVRLFKFIRTRPRFFLYHYLGFTFASAIVSGGIGWYPVHIARTYGWSAGEIGATLGPALMIGGIVSKLAGGRIVDAMFQRGYRDAQLRWYGICLLLATPIGIFASLSGSAWTFVIGIAVFMTLIGAMAACAMTALSLVTPNELRGSGVAVFNTVAGLVGAGAGPVLIAAASEWGARPSIGVGLAVTIGICCPLGAFSLLLGLRAMREAMADADRSAAT
jgi:MFS family permease